MTPPTGVAGENRGGWWEEIAGRARERETRRQVQYDRFRQAAIRFYQTRLRAAMPVLLPEFAEALLGSVVGFWVIAGLVSYFFHVRPLYTFAAFGLLYALQAGYYKYRLSIDPTYTIPRCRCAGARKDHSETVLRSRESTILKIPNGVLAAVLYAALLVAVRDGQTGAATLAAILAVSASAYFGYVMVARIGALCTTCINVAALNLLILWQCLR